MAETFTFADADGNSLSDFALLDTMVTALRAVGITFQPISESR